MKFGKKLLFTLYSIALLSAGGLIQNSCSSATAQNAIAAVEVAFDNTTTGLSATNLQDAIAEVISSYGPLNLQNALIGSWTGEQLSSDGTTVDGTFSITFNADGSATCTASSGSVRSTYCIESVEYHLYGRNLLRIAGEGSGYLWNVSFSSPTSLAIYTQDGLTLWILTKSS